MPHVWWHTPLLPRVKSQLASGLAHRAGTIQFVANHVCHHNTGHVRPRTAPWGHHQSPFAPIIPSPWASHTQPLDALGLARAVPPSTPHPITALCNKTPQLGVRGALGAGGGGERKHGARTAHDYGRGCATCRQTAGCVAKPPGTPTNGRELALVAQRQ